MGREFLKMESYKCKLKKICTEAGGELASSLGQARDMLDLSNKEGLVHPADVQRFLRNYEELIRVKTLWELYNEFFPNEVTKEALPLMSQQIERKREKIYEFMIRNL